MSFKKFVAYIMSIMLLLMMVLYFGNAQERYSKNGGIPYLPRPIAEEMVLITSAGQSTDTYIIKDTVNKLMIHNYFMPQATDLDLDDIKTVVIVIGYSEIGVNLQDLSVEDEVSRIEKILEMKDEKDMTLISIFVGGRNRRTLETEKMLSYVIPESDYIISTSAGNYDQFISMMAEEQKIPITFIDEITGIAEPLVSAFR